MSWTNLKNPGVSRYRFPHRRLAHSQEFGDFPDLDSLVWPQLSFENGLLDVLVDDFADRCRQLLAFPFVQIIGNIIDHVPILCGDAPFVNLLLRKACRRQFKKLPH